MNRSVDVILDQLLADENRILKVVAIPGHESDQHVGAKGEFTLLGRRAVGDDIARLDLVADMDYGPLIETGSLIESLEFPQLNRLRVSDSDLLGIDMLDGACLRRPDNHAGEPGHLALHPGPHQGSLDLQQGNSLAHHVRTHERAVGIVILEEGNQRRRDPHHLPGRNIDKLYIIDADELEFTVAASQGHISYKLAGGVDLGVGWSQPAVFLLVCAKIDGALVRHLPLADLEVGRRQETVLIHFRVDAQGRDQTDVGSLGRLDRANSSVVRDVNIPHLEAGALPVQPPGPEGAVTSLVGELGKRVGLVNYLRKFTAAEEEIDRAGDRL